MKDESARLGFTLLDWRMWVQHNASTLHMPHIEFPCNVSAGVVFSIHFLAQSLIVSILVTYRFIHNGHLPFTVKQVDEAVCNFLVCVEVLPFSFAFRNAFSAREYEDLARCGQTGDMKTNDVGVEPTLEDKKRQ